MTRASSPMNDTRSANSARMASREPRPGAQDFGELGEAVEPALGHGSHHGFAWQPMTLRMSSAFLTFGHKQMVNSSIEEIYLWLTRIDTGSGGSDSFDDTGCLGALPSRFMEEVQT